MKPALKIALIYVLIGGSWFVFSSIFMDEIIQWLGLSNDMTLEIIKALLFVLISGILIYNLVQMSFKIEKRISKVYRVFFEKNPNYIFVLSLEDQRILTANEAALEHFNISEVDFGKKYFDSFFQDYKNISANKGGQNRVIRNLVMIDKNYDPRNVDIFSMPFVYNGTDCVMALAVDNSEIHKSLLENMALNDSLKAQNQQLRNFSFINSHHIRRYLANILGIVNMPNEKDKLSGEALEMLKQSASKLDQEVRKVSELLKVNDGFTLDEPIEEELELNPPQKKVIVFVDDDKVQHMINKRILLKINPNLELNFFESPYLALNWLSENEADILLLDINMPGMKGWDLLNYLEEKGINIEVKMLTSSVAPEDLERSKNYGQVSGFLVKPLNEEAVEEFINH
ncbi:MAG TPA: response regulator [Cyclobacteriaceae bacterium]|nr:response regulator [Cyclobacteriaceae bacterium]